MEEQTAIFSVLLLNPIDLTIPCHSVATNSGLEKECVESFIFFGGCWVLISTKIFVVAFDVFIQEVGIEELGVGPGTSNLVH